MTDKEFIPYTQALALKELGFDETCFGYYLASTLFISNDIVYNSTNIPVIKAPTYSQAFRWFRENYGYDISIKKGTMKSYKFEIQKLVYEGDDYLFNDFSFVTYEKAELACLIKLIEIVKRK